MKIENELDILGKESVVASQEIKSLGKKEKNELLNAIIETLKSDKDQILEANKLDIEVSQDKLSNGKSVDRIVPVGKALAIGMHWDGKNVLNLLSREIEII